MNNLLAYTRSNSRRQVCIKTTNSAYKFTLIDALSRRGYLTGGALGAQLVEACLFKIVNQQQHIITPKLDEPITGVQLIFLVSIGSSTEFLITSTVIGLSAEIPNNEFDNKIQRIAC